MTVETEKQTDRSLAVALIRWISESRLRPFKYEPFFDLEGLKALNLKQFGLARKTIRIVEGTFNAVAYNDDLIIESLRDAVERGVSVELISSPEPDQESQNLWQLVKEGKVFYYQHPFKGFPSVHFGVVDGEYVRYEQPHSPTEFKERTGFSTKSPDLAASLWERFEKLKSKSQAVSEV